MVLFRGLSTVLSHSTLDLLLTPRHSGKLLLGHCNLKDHKLAAADFGASVTHPTFVFTEPDKNAIAIIDSKEFKEFSFKPTTTEKTVSTIGLQEIVGGQGEFFCYYDMKTMLVYFVFPETGRYSMYVHRKKKLVSHVEGSVRIGKVQGILGFFKKDVGDVIYVYNEAGIYSFIAKKFISNSKKPPNAIQTKEVIEEAKEKPKFKQQTRKATTSEDEGTTEESVRREVEAAFESTVLPMIDSHMKRFEQECKALVAKEIALLSQTVKEEAAKMQETGKFFENSMKHMIDMCGSFVGTLERQMKEMSLSGRPQAYALPRGYGYSSSVRSPAYGGDYAQLLDARFNFQ